MLNRNPKKQLYKKRDAEREGGEPSFQQDEHSQVYSEPSRTLRFWTL